MAGEPELKRGDTGEWVAFLNQTLGYHGHHADDGDTYEEKTEHGVTQMQRELGLPETGIMDEASWTALLAEPEPEQYALNLSDGPKVSDGKLVWTLRNDGPGKASQFVVRTELYDDAGSLVDAIDFTSDEDLAVGGTWDGSLDGENVQISEPREGATYRADVIPDKLGAGTIAGYVHFKIEEGKLVEV